MPIYDIDLSDGRTVTVESDTEPTHDDVMKALGEYEAPKPDAMSFPSMQLEPQFDQPTTLGRVHAALPEFVQPSEFKTSNLKAPSENALVEQPEQPGALGKFVSETGVAPIGFGKFTKENGKSVAPKLEFNPSGDAESVNKALTVPTQYSAAISMLPEGKLKEAAAGVYNAQASLINFFLSPQGVLAFKIPKLPIYQQRAIAAGFAAQMAQGAPKELQAGDEAYRRGDIQGAVEHWLGGASQVGFAGASGFHAARPSKPVPLGLESEMRDVANATENQPLSNPDVAASIRLGLPPRATPEMLPELQRTKDLVDKAIQEATQKIQTPGPKAIDLLKAQDAEIVPATQNLVERPGGGEAIGGKVSFNQSAESIIGKEKGVQNAPLQTENQQLRQQERQGTNGSEKLSPPIRPGDKPIEIVTADGSVIKGATNGKTWNIGGKDVPNVARPVEVKPGEVMWSDGPLRPGETIRELSTEPRQGTSPEVVGEQKLTTPETPAGPVDKAISAIESAQKKLRGSGTNLQMGVPKAALDMALESIRLSLKAGKTIADAIEAAVKKVRFNFSNFNEKNLRAELDRIIHEESKSAAGRPATGSRPSAGGVSGQPRVEGAAFEQQKSGTSLDDVYKIFEPAPKPKGPSLKQRGVNIIESLRTGISSKFRPINKLAEDIAKAYGLKKPKDIAGIMEQLKGSQGRGEAEVYRFDRDVSELVKGKEQDFNAYLFLRRSIDRLEQDVKDITRAFAGEEVPILNRRSVAGFTINSLKPRLQALEAKVGPETMAKFQEAAQKYQDYMDGALKLQVESGRMSPEIYKAIKDGNQFYAPFKVMKYIEDQMRPEGSGRKIDTVADFTKAMSGITDPNFKLGDMLASARQSLLMSRILADKNTAMQHLTELAGWDVDGRFVKRLKSGEDAPSGMEAVNVLEHGKQVRYAVDSKVAQALQLYGNTGKGVISRALGLAGVPFRAGATMLNIPFQVSNLMADVPRQALVSRYGLSGVQDMVRYPLNFVHSLMTSMQADVLGNRNPVLMAAGKVIPPIEKLRQANEKLYLDFLDSGVAGTTIQSYLTPEALKFKEPTAVSKSRKLAGSVLSTIPNFANAIEQTSKILGVKRAMRTHGVESGAELAKKVPEAVTEIRRYSGSPDFGRQGTWIENARLNLLYMFFNARLQGTIADVGRLAGRTGGKDAARMWIRIVSAVGIPTAYLYYLNHHKDNEADFMQRSEQERQNYWLIPKEDAEGKPRYITTEQGEKVRDYWRIPKRESSKWVANLVESALDFSKQKDSKAAEAFGAQMLQEISPVNIQGDTAQERLESAASSLNPLIKAPLELATGRDFYRHRNVIPENLKDVSPEEQYTPRTAELFKTVADKIPDVAPEVLRSPIVLEQMTKNLTAGLLTQFLPRPEVSGRSKLENQPLLQRFQSTPIVDTKNFQDEVQGLKRQAADERIARQRAVDKILKDNPKIESKDLYEKVPQQYKQDERFVRQLVDTWVAQKNGITVQERMLLSLPTKERAEWVAKQLNGKSPQEKSALIIEYAKKRILTEAVYAQLPEFLEKK